MAEFNKIYVNFVEDESLHGKYGYFADNIDTLRHYVTNKVIKSWGCLSRFSSSCESYPFVRKEDDLHYRFFYYDPALYISISATSRVATHRELSRWLAQGNGECIYYKSPNAPRLTFTELRYDPTDGNKSVQDIMVRKWGDDEWVVPSVTYLGLDNQGECK